MFPKALTYAALVAVFGASSALAGGAFDRIEDRRDLRESAIDEVYDHGPVDVIEDHLDRAEGHRDRTDTRYKMADRVEDRWDFVESVIDETFDHGPVDVIEDHLDRREGVHDRLW